MKCITKEKNKKKKVGEEKKNENTIQEEKRCVPWMQASCLNVMYVPVALTWTFHLDLHYVTTTFVYYNVLISNSTRIDHHKTKC